MITHPRLHELDQRLRRVYAADTAQPFDGKWSKDNPAKGHCAVVSMLVTDLFSDGVIMTGKVLDGEWIKHYYVSYHGFDIDLTFDQFPAGSVVYDRRPAERQEYFFEETLRKYLLLVERVRML